MTQDLRLQARYYSACKATSVSAVSGLVDFGRKYMRYMSMTLVFEQHH